MGDRERDPGDRSVRSSGATLSKPGSAVPVWGPGKLLGDIHVLEIQSPRGNG